MAKKKTDAAEANANQFSQEQYISVRNQMQEKTHRSRLLDYLWQNGSITSMEAFDRLHNTRISATVYDLRKDYNVPITTKMVTRRRHNETVRYGIYSIERGEN